MSPDPFDSLFDSLNGMGDRGTCDDDFFCFWALADVESISEHLPDRCSRFADASHYFIIADHSISLPSYAIRLSADSSAANPVASLFADSGAIAVEDYFESFTDFVLHYLDDPVETSAAFPGDAWSSPNRDRE